MSRLILPVTAFAVTALAITILPGTAFAHASLLSTSPAANATVAKPTKLTLDFSDRLLPSMSGVELVMTGMPGMPDHPPMPIKGFKTSVEGDGKTLIVTLPRALPAGSYNLIWHIVGVDQHRIEGKYAFTVK